MSVSPESARSDLNFDTSSDHETAWSSSLSRIKQSRRVYGKTGGRQRDAGLAKKKRRSIQRQQERESKPDPAHFEDDELNDGNALDQMASATSPSSFCQADSFRKQMDLTIRPKRGSHTRSLSFPVMVGLPDMDHSRSRPPSDPSLTSSSSLSECDLENFDPNIISQNSQDFREAETPPSKPPLKIKKLELDSINETLKTRPRKIRNISNSGPLSKSFSLLANSGETWTKASGDDLPSPRASLVFDVCDLDTAGLSPDKSITVSVTSSRKRCVWEFDDDIEETTQGLGGGGLRRSRSRVFSSCSSLKLQASHPFVFDNDEDANMRENEKEFETSDDDDDDDTELGSDIPDDLSMEGSLDGFLNKNIQVNEGSDESSFMPPLNVRRSASKKFEDCVFGVSGRKSVKLSESDILRTMPSYENLKFLIRRLRTEKKGSVISSFGKKNSWAIAPLGSWSPDLRVAFLQWGTKVLGFTVRSGGGSIAYLQISSTKGLELLDTLEAALKEHRETNGKAKAPESIAVPISVEFSIQKSRQPTPLFDFSVGKPSHRSFGLTPLMDEDNDLDLELLDAVNSIGLADKPNQNNRDSVASLTRHVTLEPRQDCLDGIVDNDAQCGRPSRHSGEHHSGGLDLLQNMHGYSPMSTSRRPSRLAGNRQPVCSSPFVASVHSGARGRYSHGSECVETPMAKFGIVDWGSHQKGRDWGISKCCPELILHELVRRFEERLLNEGNELESACEGVDENASASSVFVSFEVAGAGSRTGNLGFDLEVDNDAGTREGSDVEGDDDDFLTSDIQGGRRSSVGASLLSGLNLKDDEDSKKVARRRMGSLAKHHRVSLCAQMVDSRVSLRPRTSSFAATDVVYGLSRPNELLLSSFGITETPLEGIENCSKFETCAVQQATSSMKILSFVFSFLSEVELLCVTTPVCSLWADASTEAHSNLMLISVGCVGNSAEIDDDLDEETERSSVAISMERPWSFLLDRFPWACFLSEGAFKRVYKVWNSQLQAEEALSVMDVTVIEETGNKHVVGAELAVSALLSSLVRRNVCPNFVLTRQVFTSQYEPPASHWGCAQKKNPKGSFYAPGTKLGRKPNLPQGKPQGLFQYMRMELCTEGDIEEFIKRQPDEIMSTDDARYLLFQMAFSLHAAADRFSLKHYDVKLLNFFLQTISNVETKYTVLRYGLGSHTFSMRMETSRALVAKLADYGTANVQAESNGQPVTIGHFTTLENTPPDFLILGDAATQGHGHDAFGLGLCMLHLFTGHAPYEEILEEVRCPLGLMKKLKKIWEDEGASGYDVIRSVILADVEKDEDGVITEGQPDETFYHTFYRYLVLLGIPEERFHFKTYGRVWRAVSTSIESDRKQRRGYGNNHPGKNKCPDAVQYANDCETYSLSCGNNVFIARARDRLKKMEGGLELLLSLLSFDPEKRATATDVLNSSFMAQLREGSNNMSFDSDDHVLSYMAYATT